MYFLDISREKLLAFMPKGVCCAEIGVSRGRFARKIHEIVAPRQFHLIDPWAHQVESGYVADLNNVAQAEQDERYHSVLKLFDQQIADGSVIVHRAYSSIAAKEIPDKSLDLIYIDGDHTYEAVRSDLALYSEKITDTGLILGHDYANHPGSRNQNMGVVEAVDEFVMGSDFEFVFLTRESWPTYVLARPGNAHLVSVLGALLMMNVTVTEVAAFPHQTRFTQTVTRLGENVVVMPRFGPVAP